MWYSEIIITEQSKCPGCAMEKDQPPRAGLGRGRGFPPRGRYTRR